MVRSLALPRAVRHPRLARCGGALQADRDRRRLGGRAAIPDHGHLHHRLRQARQAAERWRRALPGSGVRGHAAVVFVLQHSERGLEQPCRQRQPHQQGLFPAPDRAGLRRRSWRSSISRSIWSSFSRSWLGIASCRTGRSCSCRRSCCSALLASLGPALCITALNVKYRDFRYIIPFIVQFGLYVSPVGFSSAVVPDEWRFWYSLNPVVGVIDGFRWCLLGGESQLYLPGFLSAWASWPSSCGSASATSGRPSALLRILSEPIEHERRCHPRRRPRQEISDRPSRRAASATRTLARCDGAHGEGLCALGAAT